MEDREDRRETVELDTYRVKDNQLTPELWFFVKTLTRLKTDEFKSCQVKPFPSGEIIPLPLSPVSNLGRVTDNL